MQEEIQATNGYGPLQLVAEVAPELERCHETGSDPVLALLERRLRALEAAMAELRTAATKAAAEPLAAEAQAELPASRRTEETYPARLCAKGAAAESGSHRGAGLDAALSSLSVEQRLAVKAGLLRAGLL